MEGDSHMISDGVLVVQNGQGTIQFPIDQVDEIRALPSISEAAPVLKSAPEKIVNVSASSEELLIEAALQEGLAPEFVRSVALVESGLRQNAVSPKGAMGLMQLMPFTAGQLRVNPHLAAENALGGATFLRQLLLKYNGDSALALAAYNAGPGAVAKYKGVPPYLETHRYVVKVLQEYARQQRLQAEKKVPASPSDTQFLVR
jgi:soluble lytic murein transglycosylase-like protein